MFLGGGVSMCKGPEVEEELDGFKDLQEGPPPQSKPQLSVPGTLLRSLMGCLLHPCPVCLFTWQSGGPYPHPSQLTSLLGSEPSVAPVSLGAKPQSSP